MKFATVALVWFFVFLPQILCCMDSGDGELVKWSEGPVLSGDTHHANEDVEYRRQVTLPLCLRLMELFCCVVIPDDEWIFEDKPKNVSSLASGDDQ